MTLAENTGGSRNPTPPRRRGNDQVVPRNQSGYPTAASRPVSFPTVDLGVCMRVGKNSISYHMEDVHHMGQSGKIRDSRAGMMLWSKQSARKTSGASSARVTCHPEEKCRPMEFDGLSSKIFQSRLGYLWLNAQTLNGYVWVYLWNDGQCKGTEASDKYSIPEGDMIQYRLGIAPSFSSFQFPISSITRASPDSSSGAFNNELSMSHGSFPPP